MKTQLIMLPQPILVSDENEENFYLPKGTLYYGGIHGRLFRTIDDMQSLAAPNDYKIIAGIPELPSIDFSALSEEDCKKIGWVDVEKLAKSNGIKYYDAAKMEGFALGFKAAQSLNEKKFSEEDMRKCWNNAVAWWNKMNNLPDVGNGFKNVEKIQNFTEFIQSLSQPKVFDVEVEMEVRDVDEVYHELQANHGDYWKYHFHHYDSGIKTIKKEFENLYSVPKITNNSIKVIKVL